MKINQKTKLICLLFLLCFAAPPVLALADDAGLALPKAQDVQRIETTNNEFRFQTPESLFRMLPHMTAYAPENGKSKDRPSQYGTILLKDGTILKWRSFNPGNVILYDDKAEQLYVEDSSFWSYFFGKFIYSIAVVASFTLILGLYVYLRNQPDGSDKAAYGYLKILGIRAGAFLVFAGLAYFLLAEPFAQMNDGRVLISGKGRDALHIVFADTEPGSFWFSLFLNSFFGLLSVFFGAIFLIVNPQSKFWRRRISQTSNG